MSELSLLQLTPEDQRLTGWVHIGAQLADAELTALVRPLSGGSVQSFPCCGNPFVLAPLTNHIDYEIRLRAVCPDGRTVESAPRMFRCGFVPGRIIAYQHPLDDTFAASGRYIGSPSICRAPDGALVASHDFFPGGQNLTHVYRSEDEGQTWQFTSAVTPCFWGSLFEHGGLLYLLATATEYGALVLHESCDGGRTWRGPVQLLPGGSHEAGGPHKAPMPVLCAAGRIWSGVEFGSWRTKMHCPGAVSAAEDSDLMDPASWQCTGFLPYDPERVREVQGMPVGGTIEGNLLQTPDGRLVDLLRFQTNECTPRYGEAYQVVLDPQHPDALPQFDRTVDFPGNLSKFFIRRSPLDGRYYALSNRVTTDALSQRNLLTLSVSDDLIHWTVCRDILNYADNCFGEGENQVGFQYPSFIFDGDDLLAVVRTAINGAHNFHDANYMTFHRIRHYRR